MGAYLFSGCMDDPVTRGLAAFCENGGAPGYFTAFARLWEFSRTQGVTGRTIREYCVRMILDVPGAGELFRLPSLGAYLEEDLSSLYALYFEVDWAAFCASNSVLPPPGGSCSATGEEYRLLMERLTRSSSAACLRESLAAFFAGNADALEAIARRDPVTFDQLAGLHYQKRMLLQNTRAFLEGRPANDVLLVGGSGTGKSSCVKAVLNRFAEEGLRLVELSKQDIDTLPLLLRVLRGKRRHYIVYIDDLVFDTADASYMGLKAALDGQVEERPPNVLVYATSNRRHLVRDRRADEEIRLDEAAGETLSLAKRFGIRLYFSNLTLSEYYTVVELLLSRHGIPFSEEIAKSASAWSEANGGRSGRSAKQFISRYIAR